jgi:hypothetical protein
MDTFESKHLTFSGIGDIMQQIRMQIAADLRMPLTKLFGISSSGFNSGEDDIENYNAMVESEIRSKVKYDVLRALEICCKNLFGIVPDDLQVEFKPLRILSAEQEEQVKNQRFQRVSLAMQSGLISAKEAKQAINRENLLSIKIDESNELLDIAKNNGGGIGGGETPAIHLSTGKYNSKGWFSKIKQLLNNTFKESEHPREDKTKRFVNKFKGAKTVSIQEARIFALKGKPVASISGEEFQKDEIKLTEKVPKFYKDKYDGEVDSIIGKVKLDEEGVKSDIAHGMSSKKAAAFMSAPEVINKGKLFDKQKNWKNRGYDSYVFIAPVEIAEKRYIEEVVVIDRESGNRQGLYLHDVELKKEAESAFKTPTKGGYTSTSRLILTKKVDERKTKGKVW